MRNEFLETVEQLNNIMLSNMPNYRTMKAIANHPCSHFPNPAVTAASIKINVNQTFVDDDELFTKTIDCYVNVLNRIYNQLEQDFPKESGLMFNALVNEMSITYTF